MEEKVPFSFRNQVYQPPNTSNSYKTTTVSTMNNDDFVVSLNKEMELILHNIDPKPINPIDNFHGSPNFNQNINEITKNNSDFKRNHKENEIFLDNDSFGQEKEKEKDKKMPFEIKELKQCKDSIDKEKFAEVLHKNYELKIKTKDLESKLSTLISELSECQKTLEESLNIQITTTISETMKDLAENHNVLKRDLEVLEDENEKFLKENERLMKENERLLKENKQNMNIVKELREFEEKNANYEEKIKEFKQKEQNNEKLRIDYAEELGKVNKLLQLNQELCAFRKENEEKLNEKDRIIEELKGSLVKSNRNLERNIREQTENLYKCEKNLKKCEIENKEKALEIEGLQRELHAVLTENKEIREENREIREENEENRRNLEKLEKILDRKMEEFQDLTMDLKEIIKEILGKRNTDQVFSQEFQELVCVKNRVNPIETLKEIIIVTFNEIQVLMNKIMNMSNLMEKFSEESEEKNKSLEEKWMQKVHILNEEKDFLYELFSKTCQMIKSERFSEIVSKLLGVKNEILTQEMEVKLREHEYFSMENHLKRLLAEKSLKPENIIQMRGELEKKKAQLIFLKKNFLKSKEELNFLEENFEIFKESDPKRSTFSNLNDKKPVQIPSIPLPHKVSMTPNEKPERLSLKDKLDKSRKFLNSPSKIC